MDKRSVKDAPDDWPASRRRYIGRKFQIGPPPVVITFGEDCDGVEGLLAQFVSDVDKVEYPDLIEFGRQLIQFFEAEDPPFKTKLDLDLPRPRRQILTEAVLLFGIRALCELELYRWTEVDVSWREDEGFYRFRQPMLEGLALFMCARPCAERRSILRGAFSSLDNADFRIVIANLDEERDDCVPTLGVNEYVILVNMYSGEYRLYDHTGRVV